MTPRRTTGPGAPRAGGRATVGLAAAVAALLAAGCGGGNGEAPDPAADSTAVGGADTPAFVADTQFVVDSSGAVLEIITSRRGGSRVREYRPRAGAGDPDQPGVLGALDPETARSMMQAARPPWYVIDVRDSRAYAGEGHLPGALLVPLDQLESNVDDLHVRTDQTVLVYGGHGDAGARAGRLLASYGFPRVRVVEGGFPAWKAAGLPVEGGP